MGCSKLPSTPCPKNPHGLQFTACGPDCMYFFWETTTGTGPAYPSDYPYVAKTIDQFTTDELLTEIRRRMK